MATKKRVFFPATRFTVDTDEKGVQKLDKRGDPISGHFNATIYESVDESSVFVTGYDEDVTWAKYNVIREDLADLDAKGVMKYFNLLPNLKEYLGEEDEEEITSKSDKTPGKADGKSGSEKTEQKSQSSSKTDA